MSLLRDLNTQNVSAGVISGMLALTGPPMIILEAAARGNFSHEQTVMWIFAVYFFGGLFSIVMPLVHRIPITGAHSISGVAFLVTVTPYLSYQEMIAGYLMSGALIFLVGITGVFSRIMNWFPKEVIAAMLAGLITTYVVRLVSAVEAMPVIGGVTLLSFFLLMKFSKRIPAVLGAAAAGLLAVLLTHDFHLSDVATSFVMPTLQTPQFSWLSLFSLAIPLCLLILSNDAAPGVGALQTYQFQPPVNRIITVSGITSMMAASFGGQCANVAGMMSAICADHEAGEKSKRYMASVVSGVMVFLFGLFAWLLVPFIQALPTLFVTILTGIALLGVLGSSLQTAFTHSKFRYSAIFTFAIAMSDLSFFHISAPVWALVVGSLIAKLIEGKRESAR